MLHSFDLLKKVKGVRAFYSDRKGGFGTGNYASFNCNLFSGDDAETVMRNRALLAQTLHATLAIPRQTHSTEVFVLKKDFMQASDAERAGMLDGFDAVVTAERGVAVCVSTADCVPILLYDCAKKVVAAVHAGWRGTLHRILPETLHVMQKEYGTCVADVLACIGPGISLQAFEVGDEVYVFFAQAEFPMLQISMFDEEKQKWHLDLKMCNKWQLLESGVLAENIEVSPVCTYSESDRYFSARKLGTQSGRIISGILLSL